MARLMKHSGVDWLGDIPADWEVIVSRFVFDQISDVDHYMPESVCDGIPYVMTGDLKKCLSAINFDSCKKISLEDYLKLNKKVKLAVGDIIFARYATIGTVCYVDFKLDCVISYSCVIIKPTKEKLFGKYLYHYLQSSAFFEDISQYINSNTQSNVGIEALYKVKIPVPPIDEQERIAAYLDDKCGRIDSVIAKTRAAVAEYKKLKQAIITRAVTRGIRANRTLKHSGIDWLGDIPDHWNVSKIKYLFSIIGGNGFPEMLQGNTVGDYPFCKVSDINGAADYVDTASNWVTQSIVDDNRFNVIPTGSILMAKIGAALTKNHRKINTVQCCIDNNTQALVPRRDDDIRYLFYLSKCIDMSWFDNNSTVPSVNNTKLLNFFVTVPPIDEQREIAAYLDEKTSAIDSLVAKKNQLVTELERLKKSLIFEYVTGKKEVAQ